jgi:four helix bundle protein
VALVSQVDMETEIKTFEDLEAYKASRVFRVFISKEVTPLLLSAKEYNLADQIKRSSRSITANIVEGYGRFHYLDNARFCTIARGSLYESLEHCITANDEQLLPSKLLESARNLFENTIKPLNGYINYLFKSSDKSK